MGVMDPTQSPGSHDHYDNTTATPRERTHMQRQTTSLMFKARLKTILLRSEQSTTQSTNCSKSKNLKSRE